MTRNSWIKSAWLLLVLIGIVLVALLRKDLPAAASSVAPVQGAGVRLMDAGSGRRGLADAGGYVVPLRDYRRIAAGTTVADDLLLQLAEPERIAVLTRYGREHSADAHLYGQRAVFGGPTDLELLQRQRVDLLVLNHLGSPAELARARDLGVEVFNLGEMRGLSTLLPNMEAVATLLGERARGTRLAARFVRRMQAVAADIPAQARKRAVYVSAHGGQLFGGGRRSSYHDVLTAAGLVDAVTDELSNFPHYDPEQLLSMDPDIVVTQHASVSSFCRVSGLSHMRACGEGGRGVVGMDDALLGDPGLGMLEAAEELRELVYGARP
jgi:iron complex transport system substrate-binding protein